jgi:hypothetical protein
MASSSPGRSWCPPGVILVPWIRSTRVGSLSTPVHGGIEQEPLSHRRFVRFGECRCVFPMVTSPTCCFACRRTRLRGSTSCFLTSGRRDRQQLRPESHTSIESKPASAATNAAMIPTFQTATQTRSRSSSCRARASARAHAGVTKSHFIESAFVAKLERSLGQNPATGALQKKPPGRPSPSHAVR